MTKFRGPFADSAPPRGRCLQSRVASAAFAASCAALCAVTPLARAEPPRPAAAIKARAPTNNAAAKNHPAPSAKRVAPAAPNPRAPADKSPATPSPRDSTRPLQRAIFPPPDLAKPPPELPPAPREKMRACAAEWATLKATHPDPLPPWRAFAVKCLTR